jgi:cytochrome b
MGAKRIRLWDFPTRLFHWLLVIALIGAVVTGKKGGNLMDWHGRIGLLMVGLLGFRLVWGIVGSTYARFAQFLPTPGRIRAYMHGEWKGEGHNPLGALSVFTLLGLLLVQVATGLVANDDIAFYGPLYQLVGRDQSNRVTGIHHLLVDGLIILVGLHLVAIAFHGVRKKQNLVKSMITGWKENADAESASGGGVMSLVAAMLLAAAMMYGASGAWMPAPSPLPAEETPSW